MTPTQFNLSEKIRDLDYYGKSIFVEDVEEFIRRLKEKLKERKNGYFTTRGFSKFINKLAGDKLT